MLELAHNLTLINLADFKAHSQDSIATVMRVAWDSI